MTDLIEVRSLRDDIIAYMSKPELSARGWYCTWWFRRHLQNGAIETRKIRQELERMERDGVVKSDHEQANNTKWRLTCTCPSGDGSLRWPCPVHPPKEERK